jgi:hypothetical protein
LGILLISFLVFLKNGLTLENTNVHSSISKYLFTVCIDIFKVEAISCTFIRFHTFEDNNWIKSLKALMFSIFKKLIISFCIYVSTIWFIIVSFSLELEIEATSG